MTAKVKILLLIGLLFATAILMVTGVGFSSFQSASTASNMTKMEDQAFLISKAVDLSFVGRFGVAKMTTYY